MWGLELFHICFLAFSLRLPDKRGFFRERNALLLYFQAQGLQSSFGLENVDWVNGLVPFVGDYNNTRKLVSASDRCAGGLPLHEGCGSD